jgi:hypothetical protein
MGRQEASSSKQLVDQIFESEEQGQQPESLVALGEGDLQSQGMPEAQASAASNSVASVASLNQHVASVASLNQQLLKLSSEGLRHSEVVAEIAPETMLLQDLNADAAWDWEGTDTAPAKTATASKAKTQPAGVWPITQSWTEGSIQSYKPGPRDREYAPAWPGINRAPTVSFKGNGDYDGGKAMAAWVKSFHVAPPTALQEEEYRHNYIGKFWQKAANDNSTQAAGSWPPTNNWVQGQLQVPDEAASPLWEPTAKTTSSGIAPAPTPTPSKA